jgi:hypothetical protein
VLWDLNASWLPSRELGKRRRTGKAVSRWLMALHVPAGATPHSPETNADSTGYSLSSDVTSTKASEMLEPTQPLSGSRIPCKWDSRWVRQGSGSRLHPPSCTQFP